MEDEAEKCWVLWWRYSDGSSAEVVRAYTDETRAKADFALVNGGLDGRVWSLTQVDWFDC